MSASVSANTMSLMSTIGFDLAQLNSTDDHHLLCPPDVNIVFWSASR
jgi:hypothetical protein